MTKVDIMHWADAFPPDHIWNYSDGFMLALPDVEGSSSLITRAQLVLDAFARDRTHNPYGEPSYRGLVSKLISMGRDGRARLPKLGAQCERIIARAINEYAARWNIVARPGVCPNCGQEI
jgi:hypothetical protein